MPNMLAEGRETTRKQMTKYSIRARKTVRGAVLDSPLKGKMTETCVAVICLKGAAAIVSDRLKKTGSER